MELREAVRVLDSDAHARDLDENLDLIWTNPTAARERRFSSGKLTTAI
jgi:hypothetical protein